MYKNKCIIKVKEHKDKKMAAKTLVYTLIQLTKENSVGTER